MNFSRDFNNLFKWCGLLSILLATQLAAQPVEKYSIAKTDNGFVRTNVETGHTSLCTLTENQLICRASADEIRAFEETNAKLRLKIMKLEEEASKGFDFSDSENVDKALDMMQGFMSRFKDMAQDLSEGAQN